MSRIHDGLVFASKGAPSIGAFHAALPEGYTLLEGLLSKGYVELNRGHVELTLAGTFCLLDFEGYDRTGKKRDRNW